MKREALVVYGGWEFHEPEKVANIFKDFLEESGFKVMLSDTLDIYSDKERLKSLDLIVPNWTTGKLSVEQLDGILEAVASGVGLAGCHAGLCDAFRDSPDWQFMVGGQFVAHIGASGFGGNGIEFEVNIKEKGNPIVSGIDDFRFYDEQYYLHVDPAVRILAAAKIPPLEYRGADGKAGMHYLFGIGSWNLQEDAVLNGPHTKNGPAEVPVIWTKYWGRGRIFYNSLGHDAKRAGSQPSLTITRRGFLWASR